ncbi:MAG: hypothetical protein A2Y15_01525 [Clostridiales bacterium GWF2_36_10]|nr:MAG: hypothetical protein A2Y15_01525 [Clostridiales bacterium GWF2_36_10]HAN22128.1 hypothetical protein [Clostridiales bacterium]
MICNQCGRELEDTDKFCDHCGKPTENAPKNDIFNEIKEEEVKLPPQLDNTINITDSPQPQQPQPDKLPKLYPQLKVLLTPYIKHYTKQILRYKAIIIALLAAIIIITGTSIISSIISSPEKTVTKVYNAFINGEAEDIIEFTTYNRQVYEELNDDDYDEEAVDNYIDQILDGVFGNNDKYTYEVDYAEILEDDEYDEIFQRYEKRYDNIDCIESIAKVYLIITDEDGDEHDSEQYCLKINGKWYMIFY